MRFDPDVALGGVADQRRRGGCLGDRRRRRRRAAAGRSWVAGAGLARGRGELAAAGVVPGDRLRHRLHEQRLPDVEHQEAQKDGEENAAFHFTSSSAGDRIVAAGAQADGSGPAAGREPATAIDAVPPIASAA